ncbi:hypothetical protein [Mesorhizobium sp. M0244]|uniref:hypothetical protein n=1 Tax=Mesorhizobium sp. M0244 TaxID=2956926 RepID=UPI003336F3D8
MRVGCPKEIKNHEYRVGLTPGSVREYVAHGHEVLVETGAGSGIGAGDNAYRAAGATIAKTAADVFAKSDMIVKVKEPQPNEWTQRRQHARTVPVASAHALNNATLHYGLQLADKGLKALVDDHHLRNGLNVHRGKITNRAVAEALGYELVEPKAVLAA